MSVPEGFTLASALPQKLNEITQFNDFLLGLENQGTAPKLSIFEIAAIMASADVQSQTLTTASTNLDDLGVPAFVRLNPNGASRTVVLPDPADGRQYILISDDTAQTITIQDSGLNTIATLDATTEAAWVVYDLDNTEWIQIPIGGGTGGLNQNLFETITADTGSTTADNPTDTLTVAGLGGLTTSITGDTLTIDGSGITGTDELVAVSANDTTPGRLLDKLIAGSNFTLTENNDGGNETITLDSVAVAAGFPVLYTTGTVDTNGEIGGTTTLSIHQNDINGNLLPLTDASSAPLGAGSVFLILDEADEANYVSWKTTADLILTGSVYSATAVRVDGGAITDATNSRLLIAPAGEQGATGVDGIATGVKNIYTTGTVDSNGEIGGTTTVSIHQNDRDGNQILGLTNLLAGSLLAIYDETNSANYTSWELTADLVLTGSVFSATATRVDGGAIADSTNVRLTISPAGEQGIAGAGSVNFTADGTTVNSVTDLTVVNATIVDDGGGAATLTVGSGSPTGFYYKKILELESSLTATVASGSSPNLIYDIEVLDVNNWYDPTTFNLTPTANTEIEIRGSARLASPTSSGRFVLRFAKTSGTFANLLVTDLYLEGGLASQNIITFSPKLVDVLAGETYQFQLFFTGTGTQTLNPDPANTWIQVLEVVNV